MSFTLTRPLTRGVGDLFSLRNEGCDCAGGWGRGAGRGMVGLSKPLLLFAASFVWRFKG